MFVGDADRERAARQLREHYAAGSLTLEEYSRRIQRALGARSHEELQVALAGLRVLVWPDVAGLVRAAARHAVAFVFTGLYALFCVILMLALAVTLLVQGPSAGALLGFLVVWLVPTYVLSRLWQGTRRRR